MMSTTLCSLVSTLPYCSPLCTRILSRQSNKKPAIRPRYLVVAKLGIESEYRRSGSSLEASIQDWILKHDSLVRAMPIYVGSVSLTAVLWNRFFSGIAPVADSGSSQSRADVLTLALAISMILTGLLWISIQPKTVAPVIPEGLECKRIYPLLPSELKAELNWVWESLVRITCCISLVIVYRTDCILQIGMASEAFDSSSESVDAMIVDAFKFTNGSLCKSVWKAGKQNYLANLALYPGRLELPFLPRNSQSVILQPLGDQGMMVVAGDTIRGFSTNDQAWIALLAEKLDVSLTKFYKNNQL